MPKRNENREWRTLHTEELNSLFCSPNMFRVIKYSKLRWSGLVAKMKENTGAFKISASNPAVNSPLIRDKRRWQDNIRIDP